MNLIICAYKAEAIFFIKDLELTQIKGDHLEYYSNYPFYNTDTQLISKKKKHDFTTVLITGEGTYNVISVLSFFLGKYQKILKSIINYGICGIINNQLSLNKIYSIQTMFGMENQIPLFKSYTTTSDNHFYSSENKINCISTQRIKKSKYKDKLKIFADIVDREAWGIGFTCDNYNFKNLFVYKLPSDYADESLNCLNIQENVEYYSHQLYEHYKKYFNSSAKQKSNQNEINFSNSILSSPLFKDNFYCTHAQYKILEKQINQFLLKKSNFFDQIQNNNNSKLTKKRIDDIKKMVDSLLLNYINKNLLPKKRTNLLINFFFKELNKFQYEFENKIRSNIKQIYKKLNLSSDFLEISYDNKEEKFNFSFKLKNYNDYNSILNILLDDIKDKNRIFDLFQFNYKK